MYVCMYVYVYVCVPICAGLTLVLAPHLARSNHHLFPISPYKEVSLVPNDIKRYAKMGASSFSTLFSLHCTSSNQSLLIIY